MNKSKTAGQLMRESFYEKKKNRKFSPEIKEILEKYKEESLKKKCKRVFKNLRNGAIYLKAHKVITLLSFPYVGKIWQDFFLALKQINDIVVIKVFREGNT